MGGIREGKPHTLYPLRLKPTGSADDGKRSSLDVTFAKGFPRGITQITPSGYPKPVGSAGFSGSRGFLFLHDIVERTQLFGFFGLTLV